MDLEALRADYEQKLLDKQDWYNGGYRTDINSGQAYRETLGFIGDAETQLNDDGFIVKGLKSVWNGATNGISSTLGAMQMLRDKNIQQHLQQQPNYVINQEAVNILDDAQKRFADWRYEVKKEDTFDTIVYGVAEGAGQMASQVATRLLLGGPAAALLMGAQIAGSQYNELRAQGVEPEKAFEASMTNGVIQGVLEEIGIEKVLKAFPAGSSLNKQIREIATRAVSEGFTESIQSLPEQFTNIWALQNNEGKSSYDTALNVAREWDKNATDNIKDMVFSGIIGTIVGAGGSGLNAVISNKLEKAIVERTTQSLEKSAELIKNKDVNAEYAQATFDALDKGQTLVNLDAEQVVQYAYNQSANIEDVAKSLGTTKEEIENAAAIGGDITVSYGHMASTMAEHNGFTEAMREHMSFGDQGKSLNYIQMQADMSKAYGEGNEAMKALDEELNSLEQSMLEAGVAKQQAKDARALANAFAVSMAPENPAEFLKKHKLRFSNEGKVQGNKGSLFQVAFHGTPKRGIEKLSTKFSGENANFHGWGVYFGGKKLAALYAGSRDQGEVTIRNKLGNYVDTGDGWTNANTGASVSLDTPLGIALNRIYYYRFIAKQFNESFEDVLEQTKKICEERNWTEEQTAKTLKLIKENINSSIKHKEIENGEIFKVDIPEDVDLLNLDKTVGEQSPKIKEILNKLGFDDNVSGQEIYARLEEEKGSAKEASLFLNSNGITGHFVEDVDEGPTYVIYNDDVIKNIGKEQLPNGELPANFYADEADFYKKYTSEVEKWNTKNKERIEEVGQYVDEIDKLFERLYAWNTNIKDHLRFYNALDEYVYKMHSKEQDDFGFTVEGAKKVISDLKKLEDGLNDGSIKEQEFYNLVDSYMEQHYNQSTEGKYKGTFNPQADGSYVINMLKGHDASTVIHETGHYFFEIFMQESGLDTASYKLKKDRAAFLNYVGMTEEQWQAADFEGRRAAHERVATAFEQYLLEGKAPSKGLRGVFARFSKWLKAIYGEVVQSPDYAGLTDDVREVFDHWLAADADIEAAMKTRGMYGKLDGKLTSVLSDKQRIWLEDQIEGARQKAAEILTKEYMSNFSSERKAAILQFRADIEPEVREQIAGLRVNQARANIADLFTQDVEIKLKYMLMSDQQVVYTEERIGKPIRIANNYLNWLGQDKSREQAYKSVINEIDACLKPELTVLEQGFGNGVRWAYVDNKTGQEISFNEAQSRDRANPGYKYKPVSKNALWYQEWFAEHDRQPTKGELLKLAEDLYCGIDKYKVYGDLLEVKSAKQKAEMDDYVKEHRKKLNELYAERDKLIADDKYLGKKRPKLSNEAALAFENLAEELGYSSGSEMAQDILNAKTEERMVQDAIRARVKEKFPDYATERALREQATLKALYDQDEGGMVAALEQQLIEEAAQQAYERELNQEQQAAKMKERIAKAKEAKARAELEARNIMLNMSISEALRANKFAMQERRAAANAKKAMKKGDAQVASEYKHQQMVLHALVRHSLVLKQEVEKTKKFVKSIKKMKKEKFGNEVNFDQIYFMLYRLGVLNYDTSDQQKYKKQLEEYNPANHTLSLQEYITQMTEKLGEGIPEIADIVLDENSNIKSNSMSIEQYEQVRDSIYNLYAIVQGDIKSTLDKQAEDFEQQKTDIKDAMKNSKTVYTPDIGGVDQESKKTRLLAERVSLDTFLNKMDDWTDGYFTKKWGGALKKCADVEATLKMEYDEAINAALKKWCPTREAMRAASEKIHYDELGGSVDKHTLINMLVQFGNESSMERLCATRPEGAENSKLWVIAGENNNYTQAEAIKITRENIINFLSRVLTKSDVEYAQAKIDAVNKLWPLLAEVNRRTKGFAPKKVEATPIAFKPKDGDYMTFRGGYYPLARDSRMGSRPQGSDALSGTEDGYMPQKTMSTVQSTSKGRTGAKYPVKLNLGYELSIIDDTIHDIAYRETMMAFNKLLSDKEMSGFLKSKLGVEYFNLLKETLWKCARPRGGQDTVMAERVLSDTGAWIKKKMVNAVIALNLKVAAQNYGNIFLYGNAVDGFDYADVIATMPDIFSGLKKHKEMHDHCMSLSPFMRERAKAPDFTMKQLRESTEAYELAKLASGKANKAIDAVDWVEENFQKFGAKLLEVTDNTTAIPIWERAYHKKIDQGATQQEAIDFADSIIRRTLGSTRIQDVASVQRGSSIYNLFTAFQGFFNTQFNQWYREYKVDKKLFSEKEYKKAFMRASMFVLSKWILACLANTVIASLSFAKPFEEDKKGWTDYEKELITYPIAMLTGPIGQAGMAIIQPALGMESYGYRMSIVENFVTKAGATAYKAANVARGKKDASELTEPMLEIVSIMLGVPLQFIRTGGNIYDWLENDMSFELEDIMTRRRKSERDR